MTCVISHDGFTWRFTHKRIFLVANAAPRGNEETACRGEHSRARRGNLKHGARASFFPPSSEDDFLRELPQNIEID